MKTWVEGLRKEYAESERKLVAYRDTLRNTVEELNPELLTVDDMLSDMHYAMEWMRTGRQPHVKRGLDIHDAYSRAILMDMELLPAVNVERQEQRATEAQKVQLVQQLMKLSNRERQCFLLHTSQNMSMAEIGRELRISKASVQTHLDRAKVKLVIR